MKWQKGQQACDEDFNAPLPEIKQGEGGCVIANTTELTDEVMDRIDLEEVNRRRAEKGQRSISAEQLRRELGL